MKGKACCWILGVLVALFLLFFGTVVGIVALVMKSTGGAAPVVEKDSYLVMDLTGYVEEHRQLPKLRLFGTGGAPSLAEILTTLDHAQDDPNIAGLILRPTGAAGFADLREIREAVVRFKASGKPVYAYLELATDRDYYLASVADSIIAYPGRSAGLVFEGLGRSSTYLKRTFEKFGLKFHVIHVGDFKGAFENLGADSMSAPLRASLQALYDDLFATYVSETDASRSPGARFEQELLSGDHLLITGPEALDKQLVDRNADWMEFENQLGNGEELSTTSVARYARSLPRVHGDHIAVLFAEGEISYTPDGVPTIDRSEGINSDDMVERLHELAEDDRVKAVVLRVNSQGGSALASDIILREVLRLKAKKSVVVSMGSVAASGGYYISCGADWIVAQPNTVTGSIGVVSVLPSAEGLYRKAEARVETVRRGKWAEFFRLDKDLTAEQRAVLMQISTGIYDEFVQYVATGRKLEVEQVHAVAQGRVWTGKQALDRKLVDQLGGLDVAVAKAAELAGMDSAAVQLRFYPEEQDWFTYLSRRLNLSAQSVWTRLWIGPEEAAIRQAADLLRNFATRREFVQATLPIEVDY
ncbi:signal peptide peptidase SppA [candidate division KSB1 bacterium]|nr:signal peptide peptidase SppA [candidate division KSB1 bacterium]